MAIQIDPVLEERIQRQLDRGAYREPSELLSHALDLVEAEQDWLLRNQETLNRDLDESFAQAARNEALSLEEARTALEQRPRRMKSASSVRFVRLQPVSGAVKPPNSPCLTYPVENKSENSHK